MEFSVSVSSRSDLARLAMLGELDAFSALQLRRPVGDAIAQGCRHFTVHLDRLTFVDAGGLGALVGLRNAVQRVDGTVTFVDASPRFRRTCAFVGLTDAFQLA